MAFGPNDLVCSKCDSNAIHLVELSSTQRQRSVLQWSCLDFSGEPDRSADAKTFGFVADTIPSHQLDMGSRAAKTSSICLRRSEDELNSIPFP
jgi:hypothetical protein